MHQFIKAAAALAIIASFGAVQAQPKPNETIKETQKPSSGMMPAAKAPAGTPNVPEVVTQTQKPSSGMQPAPKMAIDNKTNITDAQTQKPGMAADGPAKPAMKKAHKKHRKMKKAHE
ncbi:MAG: hypothetical protein ABI564_18175 [Ideonella sp.]